MTISERISLPIWKKIIILLISFILFVIQVFLILLAFDVILTYTGTQIKWLYFLTLGIGFAYALYIIHKPISPNYKLTWCCLILSFPLIFCPLYTLNSSSRRLSKRKISKIHKAVAKIKYDDALADLDQIDSDAANLARIIQHQGFAPIYKDTKYTFFENCTDKFYDLLEEVKKAEKYIYIEYFIIGQGYLMDTLIPILEEKGSNGVEIKIIYDDIGSKGAMKNKLLKRLSSIKNCKIVNYQPLGLNFNLLVNYRDHRKIFIIDGRVAYCGGDNLADEYINKKQRFGYWRDNCAKLEGDAVKSFILMFCEMWYMSTKEVIKDIFLPEFDQQYEGYVLPFADGPLNNSNPAYDLFQALISTAKDYLYISTPYFVIDDATINLIALKAKSGVDVKILMPKIPDKKSVFYMGRGNYREILKAGGKIYEYIPGFNHAKNIVVDGKYAFIGTANMDYRSLFLHYECGTYVALNPEIDKMKLDFEKAILESELIDYDKWKKRPWYQKLIAYILNIFAPLF